MPSGLFPSLLNIPVGCTIFGIPADENACEQMLLKSLCLGIHPLLMLQLKPCPFFSTSFPHTHLCSSHIWLPNGKATAILAALLSSNRPNALDGTTCNYFKDSFVDDASSLARSTGLLDFNKSSKFFVIPKMSHIFCIFLDSSSNGIISDGRSCIMDDISSSKMFRPNFSKILLDKKYS